MRSLTLSGSLSSIFPDVIMKLSISPFLLVDDEVHLEVEEPSHEASALHSYSSKHFVAVDALVATNAHGRGVYKVHARALA